MNETMKLLLSYFGPAIVAALALLVLSSAAKAAAGDCYAIADSDQRNYCLAKVRKDPGQCYAIQRGDLRAQCRAEVRQ